MVADILVPLIATGLAELGDKTQLSVFLLSSKTRKHSHLLFGTMLAFLIVDGVAVLTGSWIINIVPIRWVKIFSGTIFIIFGVLMLRKGDETKNERKFYFKNPFFSGFVLIFIMEWGDKTQIASGLFATQYNALMVLIGTMTALTLLSIMTIYLGRFISNKVDRKLMTKIAGIVFVVMGIVFFFL